MKTLAEAKTQAVAVNDIANISTGFKSTFGSDIKKAYLVMLATKKPFYVEYALFGEDINGEEVHTAYAAVVYEKNPNMYNVEYGTDYRDYLAQNLMQEFAKIERMLSGNVVGSLTPEFLQPFQAEMI